MRVRMNQQNSVARCTQYHEIVPPALTDVEAPLWARGRQCFNQILVPRPVERHVLVLPRREWRLALKTSRRLLFKEELLMFRSTIRERLEALSVGSHGVMPHSARRGVRNARTAATTRSAGTSPQRCPI